jgi:hypothetical protein
LPIKKDISFLGHSPWSGPTAPGAFPLPYGPILQERPPKIYLL